jgi:CRISP-associated protein Cas1
VPPVKSTINYAELPKFRDGLSYLYLEHSKVEQDQHSIAVLNEDGFSSVPAASLGVLMLGPGTSITHAAIKALAGNGCSVHWVGEEHQRFYASGTGETRSSRNLLKQARLWANPTTHLEVVQRMYRMRFKEKLDPNLTLEQLRGFEGVRVREAYANASQETGVEWKGRNYNRGNWADSDPINRALSAGAASLYGVCHAGIVSSGYSPALGFIHTGKQLSFVYDAADLYKAEALIPTAFAVVAESEEKIETRVRTALRETIRTSKLLERVVKDLHTLFEGLEEDEFSDDAAKPGAIWDINGEVSGGTNYGDLEEQSTEPEDDSE